MLTCVHNTFPMEKIKEINNINFLWVHGGSVWIMTIIDDFFYQPNYEFLKVQNLIDYV